VGSFTCPQRARQWFSLTRPGSVSPVQTYQIVGRRETWGRFLHDTITFRMAIGIYLAAAWYRIGWKTLAEAARRSSPKSHVSQSHSHSQWSKSRLRSASQVTTGRFNQEEEFRLSKKAFEQTKGTCAIEAKECKARVLPQCLEAMRRSQAGRRINLTHATPDPIRCRH
jgi:hypothetical protein